MSNKLPKLLVSLIAVLVTAGGVFFLFWWYGKGAKVSATTSAYRIDLPKEIKKQDISYLTGEQKKLIDEHIADVLSLATKNREQTREIVRPVAVVLVQNNQPIIQNIEIVPVTSAPPIVTPTVSLTLNPSPTITPSEIPLSPSPTLVPSPTLTPPETLVSPSPTLPLSPTPTTSPSIKISPSPTRVSSPTPSLAPGDRQITFNISSLASQLYRQKNNADLGDDINKIYQEARKVYGPPFRNIDVSVEVGSGFYYNVSLNSIIFHQNQIPNRQDLIWLVLLAFHDDLVNFMPQNWEDPLREIATQEIYRHLFDPNYFDAQLNLPLWHLINGDGLSNKNGDLYANDRFTDVDYYALGVTTLYKPYLEDNQFIVKFNQAVYNQSIDNQLPDKLNDLAAGLITSVDGQASRSFFWNHYVLRTTSLPGAILNAKTYNNQVILTARLTQGEINQPRSGKNGANISYRVRDTERNYIVNQNIVTDSNGIAQLGALPTVATYSGAINFFVSLSNSFGSDFWYPYFYGKPVVPGGEGGSGIFGSVAERKTGFAKASFGPSIKVSLTNGAFLLGAGDYRGSVKLEYLNAASQSEQAINFTKNYGPYFIDLPSVPSITPSSSPQTRGGSRGGAVDCASGWQEYKNDKFGFSFKIPSGWSDATIEEMQPENLAYRSLISTLVPEQQLDPRYKISRFEILASTGDLKTHPDYGRWFDNNTGNQVKSTVEFKGLTDVEKYVDETEMPCSSQTEQNPTSCNHRFEMYYFKKDNVYYLLNIGIYTTAELKEKNEAILNCFLENFQL